MSAPSKPAEISFPQPLRQPMPAWAYLLLFTVAQAGALGLVLLRQAEDHILYFFILPAVVAAIFYERAIYLTLYGITFAAHFAARVTAGSHWLPSLAMALVWLVTATILTRKVRLLFDSYERAVDELEDRRGSAEQLRATAERRAAHLALLAEIGSEITAELDLQSLQERAVTLAHATFGYDLVALVLVNEGGISVVAKAGPPSLVIPDEYTFKVGEGLLGWVCQHGETVLVDDVESDDRYVNPFRGSLATQSELVVPLRVRGEVVGAIDVQEARRGVLGADDARVLELLAGQLGAAMGNARWYEAVQHELNERLRAESALRESEERLSLALEGADLGVWEWDTQADIVTCNRRVATMLEISPEALPQSGAAWAEMLHPEDRMRAGSMFGATMGPKAGGFAVEQRMRTAEGRWLWVLARGRALAYDEAGRPTRIAGTFLDITARREAELALLSLNASLEAQVTARTAELQAERDKSKAILETTGDAIALVDVSLAVEYVNPAFETLTGYASEEARTLPIHTLLKTSDITPEAKERMHQAVKSGEPWNGEMALRRKDGTSYDALIQIAAMHGPWRTASGYLMSLRDITQLKTLQRMQRRFIANVSHELRTPVTVLKLYTDMLADAPEDRQAEYRTALSAEVDRLSKLVQDVLHINTLSAGGLRLQRLPVSLNYLVDELVAQHCAIPHHAETLDIVLDLAEPGPVANVDSQWLMEALCQLVENAVAYTPDGGRITIATGSREIDGQARAVIWVSDTGRGIPPSEQALVFERFFRGTYADQSPTSGSGLGLSIVKAVVELHGGEVSVESTADEGTTFALWLPQEF